MLAIMGIVLATFAALLVIILIIGTASRKQRGAPTEAVSAEGTRKWLWIALIAVIAAIVLIALPIPWLLKIAIAVLVGGAAYVKFVWLKGVPFYLKHEGKDFGEWLRSWGSFSGWFGFNAALLAIIWGIDGWDKVEYFVASRSFATFYWTMHFVYVVILGGPLGGRGGSGALQFVRSLTYGIVFYPLLALTLVQMLLIGIGTKPIPLFFQERGKGAYTQIYQSPASSQPATHIATVPQQTPQPTTPVVPAVNITSTSVAKPPLQHSYVETLTSGQIRAFITPTPYDELNGASAVKIGDIPSGTRFIHLTDVKEEGIWVDGRKREPRDKIVYLQLWRIEGSNYIPTAQWRIGEKNRLEIPDSLRYQPSILVGFIPCKEGKGMVELVLSYS